MSTTTIKKTDGDVAYEAERLRKERAREIYQRRLPKLEETYAPYKASLEETHDELFEDAMISKIVAGSLDFTLYADGVAHSCGAEGARHFRDVNWERLRSKLGGTAKERGYNVEEGFGHFPQITFVASSLVAEREAEREEQTKRFLEREEERKRRSKENGGESFGIRLDGFRLDGRGAKAEE